MLLKTLLRDTSVSRGFVEHDRLTLLITPFCLLHVKIKPRILGSIFCIKPVRAHPTRATDAAPIANKALVTKEAPYNFHAVEPEQVALRLRFSQVHVPYPHLFDAMSCSSLPTASA